MANGMQHARTQWLPGGMQHEYAVQPHVAALLYSGAMQAACSAMLSKGMYALA